MHSFPLGSGVPQWTAATRHPSRPRLSALATAGLAHQGALPRRHLLSLHGDVPRHAGNRVPDPAAPTRAPFHHGLPSSVGSSDRQHGLGRLRPASAHLTTQHR